MRATLCLLVGLALSALVAGCDNDGPGRPRRDSGPGGDSDGGPGSGETGAQCSDGIDNDGDGVRDCDEASCATVCGRDGGPRTDGGFMGCDSVERMAETSVAPVDIVWIIDNSGSMDEETDLIQTNLNGFVSSLTTSGIEDYRVVVITDPSAFGLSVPPPLGTDPVRFRLVVDNVQSNDALSHVISTYPMWSDFIRPDSLLHIIHVTDDESDMSASTFRTMMSSTLGGRSWTSHAIASPPGSSTCPFGGCPPFPSIPGCTGPHGDAADNGDEYWSIAMMTGGLTISICSSDWSAVFDQLEMTIGVPMPIPCEFTIPEPPEGMTFDRRRVNVLYTPGSGAEPMRFPYVGMDDGSANCAGGNGWYYDNPLTPTQIILCPNACDTVEADDAGTVTIELGCETIFG